MLKISYTKIQDELPHSLFEKYLQLLPAELVEKNFRYRRWQDRHLHLFGKLLLSDILHNSGFENLNLGRLKYTEHKKPYFEEPFDFNTSHSGNYVICALTDLGRIGIDIEQNKTVNFDDFQDTMNSEQWELIKGSKNPVNEFFRMWSIKESVIKADSKGLDIPLKEISILEDRAACYEQVWNLKRIDIDKNYACYIATDFFIDLVQIEYLDYYDLNRKIGKAN
jgi:4'-phosphopantetheinyl transferase